MVTGCGSRTGMRWDGTGTAGRREIRCGENVGGAVLLCGDCMANSTDPEIRRSLAEAIAAFVRDDPMAWREPSRPKRFVQ